MKNVAIIGGGIAGLSAAYFLKKKTNSRSTVTVFEKEPRLGGQIQTERQDSFLIEAGPESFVSYKKGGLELCQDLGLQDDILEPNQSHAKTFVLHRGRLVEMPPGIFSPFSQPLFHLLSGFASTSLLSWPAKLRMAREVFVPRRRQDSDEPVRHFIERRLGKEFFEVLLAPLLTGIYGGEPSNLSTKVVLREYYEAERNYGGIFRALLKSNRGGDIGKKTSVFLSLRNGVSSIINKLQEAVGKECVVLKTTVQAIIPENQQHILRLSRGDSIQADAVILATPAHASAALLQTIDPEVSALLLQIPYASSSVITLGFHREDVAHDLQGYGFIVPSKERLPFSACTWSSSKWEGRAAGDKVLLRVYVPGIRADHNQLAEEVFAKLQPILSLREEPLLVTFHPHPHSLPQYTLGHAETVARIFELTAKHPGLFLAGAAYRGIGIPDCIQGAKATVEEILAYLQRIRSSQKEVV